METTSRPVSESLDPGFAAQPAVDGALDPHLLAKIAIVDDEPINIKVVRKHLQIAGYQNFITTTDSTEAMALIVSEMPDVILLDVMMPQVSG